MEELEKQMLMLEKSVNKLKEEIDFVSGVAIKFDREINRQTNLINKIKEFCVNTNMTSEEYEQLLEMIEEDEKNVK